MKETTKPCGVNTGETRVKSKPWYKSITIWVNLLSVLAVVLEQQLELLRPLLDDKSYAFVAIIVACINLYLRLYVHNSIYVRKRKFDNE